MSPLITRIEPRIGSLTLAIDNGKWRMENFGFASRKSKEQWFALFAIDNGKWRMENFGFEWRKARSSGSLTLAIDNLQ